MLAPIRIDRPTAVVPEPSPSNSQTSKDGLIGPDSPNDGDNLATHLNKIHFSDESSRNTNQYSSYNGRNLTANGSANRSDTSFSSSNATLIPNRPPMPTLSIDSPRGLADPEVSSMYGSDKDFTTVPLHHQNRKQLPGSSSLQSVRPGQNDHSLSAEASLAARYEQVALKNEGKPNKIMTPAQFERYREQKEMTRRPSNASSIFSYNNESEEEEEDEAEQKRRAADQRKKQEAHLSVYRQQMMKITGEQAKLPSLDGKRESLEPPAPSTTANRQSTVMPDQTPGSQGEAGDEDDDVPLAILAAHGFPNRNRPPSQLIGSSSNPNLRSSYMQGPPSVVGDLPSQRRRMPAFAKNLPQDPYFGAGLVHQTNRESLALGGGSPSVYGGSTPNLPPGGLVGVIANEERARAMRRGSPNANVSFDMPGTGPGMNQFNPGFNPNTLISQIGGQPNGMMPGDQNQMQVSQQMTQMMQMQMQWMQQMMQMQTMQIGQPMSNPNFLQPPGPNQRPMSMMSNLNPIQPGVPQANQRALSMLDPSYAQWNRRSAYFPSAQDMNGSMGSLPPMGVPGYAPSVAPSERSNIGTASRYRPVSTIQPLQQNNRSSTFTASTSRPWMGDARNSSFTSVSPQPRPNPLSTANRPVSGLVTSAKNANDDDEDDEAAWKEMAKAKEKKSKGWRLKRGSSPLSDVYHSNQI